MIRHYRQMHTRARKQNFINFFYTAILLHTFLYLAVAFTQDNGSEFYYVSVEENGLVGIPTSFEVSQNCPNPFNPSTKITYSVAEGSKIRLAVYDILGREVDVLVNDFRSAGIYELNWTAENLPSGLYLYTFEAGSTRITKKMTLLK